MSNYIIIVTDTTNGNYNYILKNKYATEWLLWILLPLITFCFIKLIIRLETLSYEAKQSMKIYMSQFFFMDIRKSYWCLL